MNWHLWWQILVLLGGRYFLIAGFAFVAFYMLFRSKASSRRIQTKFPKSSDYGREISYSVLTLFIFAAVPAFIFSNPFLRSHTTVYTDVSHHGMLYFFAAFPLMAVMHDTYFYWTHRLMHHRKLFKMFHLVHHRSVNPSPWAAYSFHPLEAIVEVGIYVLFVFTIPVHLVHIVLFFLFMIVYNVYGHLGYELYPKGFSNHFIGKWINTSVSHNMHHQHFGSNYGLYFTFWDRVMGTMHTGYDQRFDQVTSHTNASRTTTASR